ncbi:hypothetical protein CBNA_0939 [Coxiella burnetii str. Namibia]|nr:hypothetical protein CBNA_0939 [Coxiella burnetii str. Namibia]
MLTPFRYIITRCYLLPRFHQTTALRRMIEKKE